VRQYVKFTFLKVDPAWRRLPAQERASRGVQVHGAGPADHVEQGRSFGQQLAQGEAVHLEGEVLVLATAVDHAGHLAIAAQAAVGTRSALRALLDV